MNEVSPEPSGGSLWLTVIAVVACFLLFAIVLGITYLPTREAPVTTPVFSAADMKEVDALPPAEREARMRELRWERKIPTPADRKARLLELRDHEAAALTNYAWIDRDKGVVRLPIARAEELTLQEIARGTGH